MATPTNSQVTKEQILKKAIVRFLKEGYHRVGMDQIADDAYVSRQTIYYYFPTKEKLRFKAYQFIMNKNLDLAFKYTEDATLRYCAAIYLIWYESQRSDSFRHFMMDIANDISIYNEKYDYCRYYKKYYIQMYKKGHLRKDQELTRLSSAYGHTHTLFKAVFQHHPELQYVQQEYMYGMSACAYCYEIPAEEWDPILSEIEKIIGEIRSVDVDKIIQSLHEG